MPVEQYRESSERAAVDMLVGEWIVGGRLGACGAKRVSHSQELRDRPSVLRYPLCQQSLATPVEKHVDYWLLNLVAMKSDDLVKISLPRGAVPTAALKSIPVE